MTFSIQTTLNKGKQVEHQTKNCKPVETKINTNFQRQFSKIWSQKRGNISVKN